MKRWILTGFAALATAAPAQAAAIVALPDPGGFALLALGVAGVTIGWLGARGPRRD